MITYWTTWADATGATSTWVEHNPPPLVDLALAALDVIADLAHLKMIRSLAGPPLDPPPPASRGPAPTKATTWLARRRARR